MKAVHLSFFAYIISAVYARQFTENDPNMPIKEIHTSYGQGDHERITYIKAVIEPHHINLERLNFPRTGHLNAYYQEASAPGDERGHLVGSQFSGPVVWYNLSPQSAQVNRNLGLESILVDWYGTECEVRKFLNRGEDRSVVWEVNMNYEGNSNRPNTYRLRATFYKGQKQTDAIDTTLANPFTGNDSTFWICRECRSSNHQPLQPGQNPNEVCSRRH